MKKINMCDLNQSLTPLIQKGTILKTSIIKNKIFERSIDKSDIIMFKTSLDSFLNQWTEYADEIKSLLPAMINISIKKEFSVIEYDYIKKIIFNNCDYESIRDFLDGIILGLNDNKIQRVAHIRDYFQHTINMAFDANADSIGELVDARSSKILGLHIIKVNRYELKMFDIMRNYDMFDREDRIDIYKSTSDVIDNLTKADLQKTLNNAMAKFSNSYDLSKMWISIITHIIDYAIYSATVYATRINIIGRYVNNFIPSIAADTSSTITESVENIISGIDQMNITDDINTGEFSRICGSIDERLIRDPNKIMTLFNRYREFLRLIGVINIPDGNITEIRPADDNTLYNEIKNNDIVQLLGNAYFMDEDEYGRSSKFNEFHHNLKYILTNPLHGLSSTSNSKNELLHIIRKNDYHGQSFTINIHKKMAEELFYTGNIIASNILQIMNGLGHVANRLSNINSSDTIMPRRNNGMNYINDKKHVDECSLLLIGLYEEIMFAIHQKFVYIESCINRIHNIEKKDLDTRFAIDNRFIANKELTAVTTISVPETLRTPIESQDMFTLTTFEEACLNDEILRSTPGFENSLYLSEAAESKTINLIISLIQGLINSASIFFFKNFKPASDWVVRNKDSLLKINFSKDDKISNVYRYNLDIQNNNILNGISISKLPDTLRNFNKDEILKDTDKWIKSLYPDDKIYEWFKADEKIAAAKYQNKILFNIESEKPADLVELSGAELKKEFDSWVNDMMQADAVAAILVKSAKDIDQAVKILKNKTITESVILEADAAPEPVTEDPNNKNQKDNNTNEPKVEINGDSSTIPLVAITEVITRTWKPLYDGVIKIFTDEYKNIKAIHQQSFKMDTNKSDQK